ncbi:MAG: AmmeMemoRadiSam system protein A [Desulfococcaceae bacterium]|jgi:AmmeMemoRadiSam system protein A|nr:AmmeMemoRadiSam system protein A [Desulfococcaceae bacterium]
MAKILNEEDRKNLLQLARSVIASELSREDIPETGNLSPAVREKQGCFVTLHKKGMLRGCIGTIEPVKALADAVKENALHSAFRDSRFPPLKAEELPETDIEISVLTKPEILSYRDGEDLITKLKPGIHGVILSKDGYRSTFLPQVWEQLPDPEIFLSHLCRKGGMGGDCWKKGDVEVKVYEVFHFSE